MKIWRFFHTYTSVDPKKPLRKQLIAHRQALSDVTFNRINQAIIANLTTLPELAAANTVHCFWPILEKRELDTTKLIKFLQQQGKQVVLPVVISFEDPPQMAHRLYDTETNLKTNRWGIKEPVHGASVDPAHLDAVIVPALGLDLQGHRLGYGKGFYDAFLAKCTCPFICPLPSYGILKTLPALPHDIPVDIIVTEKEVLRLPRSDTRPNAS